MASFQTKIGWERQKREKIKIIVPFRSHPTGWRKFQKNSKKFKKLKKNYHYGIISSQNSLEKAEEDRK